GPEVEKAQVDRLASLRARRDSFKMAGTLEALQEAAAGDENLMPYLLEAVKADATLGEICAALKEVFGTYKEPVVIVAAASGSCPRSCGRSAVRRTRKTASNWGSIAC